MSGKNHYEKDLMIVYHANLALLQLIPFVYSLDLKLI